MKLDIFDKTLFRTLSLQRLKTLPKHRRYIVDKWIISQLYSEITRLNATQIMLYLPLQNEVNTFALINKLRQEKRSVYVPFMEGTSFRLVQYRLPLETKKFGIKEPKYSNQYKKKEIDIAIVPIVGLDITLRRIGFGKGMYDRFFEKKGNFIKKTVFIARELCYTTKKITDDYDIGATLILTR